ncbi:MAG: tRNA (adenine(22)-N(1))-methyltransferase TrmK [Bacteroidota bacterium]
MPKDWFYFKQFKIYQPYKDVMKVSTDSVLLGCYANVIGKNFGLDIGCGTGLLALMLAQKNSNLKIIAIDINENAYKCAQQNVLNSKFANQIEVFKSSLQEFIQQFNQHLFDIIICNPPYYSNSLQSPIKYKNTYRHQEDLKYDELLNAVSLLMSNEGNFYVLIPYYEVNKFNEILQGFSLYIHSEMAVYSNANKPLPYLYIMDIKKEKTDKADFRKLIIMNDEGQYTEEYKKFTKDFYLNF